jgi:hypothetical protein
VILADNTLADATLRDVASFAAAAGPEGFALDFLADFFEELLLIRDFFVTAIVVLPEFGFELLYANL